MNNKIFKYLKNDEIKAILELKNKILKLAPLVEIIFYGSKIRGDFDSESDIDLLIIVPHLTKDLKYRIIDIATEIELKYNTVFGLVIISEEKYKKSNLFKNSLYYKNIKNEGALIWITNL